MLNNSRWNPHPCDNFFRLVISSKLGHRNYHSSDYGWTSSGPQRCNALFAHNPRPRIKNVSVATLLSSGLRPVSLHTDESNFYRTTSCSGNTAGAQTTNQLLEYIWCLSRTNHTLPENVIQTKSHGTIGELASHRSRHSSIQSYYTLLLHNSCENAHR